MVDPDVELVQQARAGNQEAFGKLAGKYYEMVFAVAFGVLHHREMARDVAQEVFMKAQREISRFEGKSKFKTWIYRITVNASIDEQRRKKPSQSLDATDASDDEDEKPVIITDTSAGPREKAEHEELKKLVAAALEKLSPDHRAVLVLREWQDLSYDEIAETLGLELGTVMSRLFYARKKLAEVLSGKLEVK